MKKSALVLICSFFFVALAAGSSHAVVLKIATLAPEGAYEITQMRAAAKEILTRTQGRVKFKFFTGGVMGNDQGVLRKIRINQLQGGAVSTGSLSEYYPDNQIYSLPLLFNSFDEVDYVRKRMDPVLIKGFEKSGFIVFGIAEGGFAFIMSNSPVLSINDLQKQKVWIPDNDKAALEAVNAFKVRPIPLSVADVRTGLQTGLLDTVAIPPAYAILLHWHTQIKYITQLPLLYTTGVLAVSKRAFNKIDTPDRQTVKQIMGRAFVRIDNHNRKQNAEAIIVLKDMGMQFVNPDPRSMLEWKEKAMEVPERLVAKGIITKEINETMNSLLGNFRAQ